MRLGSLRERLRKLGETGRSFTEERLTELKAGQLLTRRAFLKLMIAGSVAASLTPFAIASQRFLIPRVESLEFVDKKIGHINDLEPNSAKTFGYPGEEQENPQYSNLLIRLKSGEYVAYNRTCTHLRCSVNYEADRQRIFCPCHAGTYNPGDGTVMGGPPPRALPLVELKIDENGDIWATGIKGVIGRGR